MTDYNESNETAVTIFITCRDEEEATRISHALVQRHLIACGNILKDVTSIFHWQGEVEQDNEVLLIAKSRKGCLDKTISTVNDLHSYQTPEVIAMPIIGGSGDYLQWIYDETGG